MSLAAIPKQNFDAAAPDVSAPSPTPARTLRNEPARPLVVLKFGSSILRTPDDAPEAVTEIYRWVRQGRRVLAVVSAFQGVTDRLLAEARAFGCEHDNPGLAHYVALGEETSAALLSIACDRAGLSAIALSCAELGLRAEGDPESADPTDLDSAAIEHAFHGRDVVIAPGYTARDSAGRTVLLGRGGSDLSAVFLADRLGAERMRLVKDVDGVYDRDPNHETEALRFSRIGWDAAREVTGKLVQDRALEFAARHGLEIEVGAASRDEVTVIGHASGAPVRRVQHAPLRVAVAGCGVVGGGVVDRLLRLRDDFEVVGVLVRDTGKDRGVAVEPLLTTDPETFLASRPDVVVDALSCASTSAALMRAALNAGVHVVSANKQAVIAAHADLFAASARTGARLLYSAAVGGGAPLIELVRRAKVEGSIVSVEGVLNGTVNFILNRLAAGEPFPVALAAAQAAGLAEEDPSADLDGRDAGAKLRILGLEAFGAAPPQSDVRLEALDAEVIARASKTPLKQVSRLSFQRGGMTAEVTFSDDPAFAGVGADRNLLRVTTSDGRVWVAQGRGAGRGPTTESVLADLIDLTHGRS